MVAVTELTEHIKWGLFHLVTLRSKFHYRTDLWGCQAATPYLVNVLLDHYKIEAAAEVDPEAARAVFKSVFRLCGKSCGCMGGRAEVQKGT